MLTYLASPYSPKAPPGITYNDDTMRMIRESRYELVCKMAARLMENGYHVFCPIAHSHPIEVIGMCDIKDGDWWLKQDFEIIQHCGLVLVYMLPEWDRSYGIGKEIEFAKKRGIPVQYINIEGEITDEPVPTVYPSKPVCALPRQLRAA